MRERLEVSVVVCTRNRNSYLKKCITYLLKQSYPLKEIIIIDDYSTEDNDVFDFLKKELSNFLLNVKKLFNLKTKLILIKNMNQSGIVKSRNLGVKVATGNIIAFLDDDGFPHRSWLKNLIKNYNDKQVVGVGGPFIEIGRKNVKAPTKPVKRMGYISKKEGRIIFNYRIKRFKDRKLFTKKTVPFLLGGNMSFRREVLLIIKGGDIRFTGNAYHEETDMSFRASKFGKLVFEPNAVTYHNTAKKGGNRDVVKFELDTFLFYMFRNSSFFFLKHFGLKKAFNLVKNLIRYQIKMLKQNKTGLSRDYLKLKNVKKSLFFIFKGCINGFYCWFKTRKRELGLIFSKPKNIEVYQIMMIGSSIKIIELENRTHFLKRLFGL